MRIGEARALGAERNSQPVLAGILTRCGSLVSLDLTSMPFGNSRSNAAISCHLRQEPRVDTRLRWQATSERLHRPRSAR